MAVKDDKTEEELIPVGDGVDFEPSEHEEELESLQAKKLKKGDKEELEEETEEEESEGDKRRREERAGHSEEDDEDPEERRRQRKTRRQRQREARDRNQTELRYLRNRNDQLERRFSEIDFRVARSEVSAIDTRISQAKQQIKMAEGIIAKAIKAGNGEDAVEAQAIRDDLRRSLDQLEGAKTQHVQHAQKVHLANQAVDQDDEDEPAEVEATQVDPDVKELGTAWMKAHPWYKYGSKDRDSRIVSVIDTELTEEGFDPADQEYWDELTERIKEALPHRFKNGADDEEEEEAPRRQEKPAKKKAGGPRFSTGGRERSLKKGEVYINPERKRALIEAGAWDDPVLRQRYLKAYANYDREHGSSRS